MSTAKTCPTCGAKFTPTGRAHRFCSRECRPHVPPSAPLNLKCKACGTTFTRGSPAQRYCSATCRASKWNQDRRLAYAGKLRRPKRNSRAIEDPAVRARVGELRAARWTLAAIAAEVGVTRQTVSAMLKAIEKAKVRTESAGGQL